MLGTSSIMANEVFVANLQPLRPGAERYAVEFASRHMQYEMFYAGAQFVTKGHSARTYDWDRARQLVQDMLNRYNLEDALQDIARSV